MTRRHAGHYTLLAFFCAIVAGSADAQCDDIRLGRTHTATTSHLLVTYFRTGLGAARDDAAKKAAASDALLRLPAQWNALFTAVVSDSIDATAGGASQAVSDEILGRMGEVARTDQQVGAPASASSSSSSVVKPGLVNILSLAVERGAVQREDTGTGATFSATPYALLLLGMTDSTANFNRYENWRRLGVSATFDLDEGSSTASGGLEAEELSALSTRMRLYGNRDTRSADFIALYGRNLAGKKIELAEHLVLGENQVFNQQTLHKLSDAQLAPGSQLRVALEAALAEHGLEDDAVATVDNSLKGVLCATIVEPIRSQRISVGDLDRQLVVRATADALKAYNEAQRALEATMDEFNSGPLITLVHTWNRLEEGSDYSTLVLAADGTFTRVPFTATAIPSFNLVLNASVGLNHHPDKSMDQETVRELAVASSLEKSFLNPLRLGNTAEQSTRLLAAVTGRFTRQLDSDDNIGIAEARVAIPLVRGFSLALSVNYATRTETDSESEVRFNGAVQFNGDTFASLSEIQDLLSR